MAAAAIATYTSGEFYLIAGNVRHYYIKSPIFMKPYHENAFFSIKKYKLLKVLLLRTLRDEAIIVVRENLGHF